MTRVKDIDRGYRRFLRNARSARTGQLRLGVFGRAGQRIYPGSSVSVKQVAGWHEGGTRRMPRRPWLSSWWDANAKRLEQEQTRILQRNLRRGDVTRAYQALGRSSQARIIANFQRLVPLARSTVRTKRSSRILVETGLFRDSIRFRAEVSSEDGRKTVVVK